MSGLTKILPKLEVPSGEVCCSFKAIVPLLVVPLCQMVRGEFGVNL